MASKRGRFELTLTDMGNPGSTRQGDNLWSFSIASRRYDPCRPRRKVAVPTQYYSSSTHRWAFLPGRVHDDLISRGTFR